MSTIFWDLETGFYESRKRKGSPFDARNKIYVSAHMSLTDTEVTTEYDRGGIPRVNLPWDTMDVLVGHNIKFDLMWIWGDPALKAFLRRGGKVYDTIVGEYLLSAQQSTYASLDSLALKYGGTLKDDQIKAFWKAGIDTCDIDPDLLLPYAKNDILNTRKVYEGQIELVKRAGMLPLVEAYMDHLLAITEMEYNGLYLDLEAAGTLRKELEAKKAELHAILQGTCDQFTNARGLPPYEFSATKPRDISAILFGTPIPVKERVVDGVYKAGAKKAGQEKIKIVNSEIDLGGFGIIPTPGTEYKAKGTYKSDDDILQAIKDKYSGRGFGAEGKAGDIVKFVQALQDYRATAKTLGTYLYGLKPNGDETGFIPLVHPQDGCIHHTLDMVYATTGRLNARSPNMQNVPRTFRNMFPSRYGEEGVILEFDYSQLEIGISAYLSQSENLMKDLVNGVDFHIKRASYVERISYEEALHRYNTNPAVWKDKRQQAKAVSYAKAYGAHPEKIAEDTGLKLEDIERIFAEEAREYPEIIAFNKQMEEEAKRNRIPTQNLLQIRDKETRQYSVQAGEYQGIGIFKSITGKQYAFYEYGSDSEKLRQSGRGLFRYFKSTELANYPVQGLGADIMATTIGRIFRKIILTSELNAVMINEVHDSLVFDCKNKEEADRVESLVKPILLDIDGAFQERFGVRFNVPIGVDSKCGRNWSGDD